jgi:glycopeptide antibiotics resistance protein
MTAPFDATPNGKRSRLPRLPLAAILASTLLIMLFTLTPSDGENELHLIPLSEIGPTFAHPLAYSQGFDLLGNIALFAPLGGSLRWLGLRLRPAVALGAGLSAVIEIVQLGIPGRFTSTDDLILNTVGAAVGYLGAAWAISRAGEARAPGPRRTPRS